MKLMQEDQDGYEVFLHCSKSLFSDLKIVGRDSCAVETENWAWVEPGQGWVYALSGSEGPANDYGQYCYVLGWDGQGRTEPVNAGGGEWLVPLDSYKVIQVAILSPSGEVAQLYFPQEWLEKF